MSDHPTHHSPLGDCRIVGKPAPGTAEVLVILCARWNPDDWQFIGSYVFKMVSLADLTKLETNNG